MTKTLNHIIGAVAPIVTVLAAVAVATLCVM